ncbi:MAG: DNA methylase, partial [Armatimonadota bacterium]
PDNYFDAVITDPPYYDNVYYSVLSDFFYVWLKRTIGHLYPELFATPLTPKSEEMVMDRIRHKNPAEAKAWFEAQFLKAMREIHRVLKPDGIAVIVFAHKTTEAWETVLNALLQAGLYPTASWPIHTEMKTRLRAQESAAVASSIYLVCRKRTSAAVGYWSEVRPKVQAQVERRLSQFWDAGIRGADLFMSAIGPAMEAFGQYARVERGTGEPVSAAELLELVQQTVSTYALKRILHEDAHAGDLDPLSRFYLLYRWSYGRAEVPFDEARKLAASVGLELTQVWGAGQVVEPRGEKVRVLAPQERAWGVRPSGWGRRVGRDEGDQLSLLTELGEKSEVAVEAWEALLEQVGCSLIEALQLACVLWEGGQHGWLAQLLKGKGYGGRPVFWLLAQAVAEVLPSGDKEKQLLQGLLAHWQR